MKWLCELCSRGYSHQIVMSMDITRKSHHKANGGLGYTYLLDILVPSLEKAGIKNSDLTAMLYKNPMRIYHTNGEKA